jgi:hypothetical protein
LAGEGVHYWHWRVRLIIVSLAPLLRLALGQAGARADLLPYVFPCSYVNSPTRFARPLDSDPSDRARRPSPSPCARRLGIITTLVRGCACSVIARSPLVCAGMCRLGWSGWDGTAGSGGAGEARKERRSGGGGGGAAARLLFGQREAVLSRPNAAVASTEFVGEARGIRGSCSLGLRCRSTLLGSAG